VAESGHEFQDGMNWRVPGPGSKERIKVDEENQECTQPAHPFHGKEPPPTTVEFKMSLGIGLDGRKVRHSVFTSRGQVQAVPKVFLLLLVRMGH